MNTCHWVSIEQLWSHHITKSLQSFQSLEQLYSSPNVLLLRRHPQAIYSQNKFYWWSKQSSRKLNVIYTSTDTQFTARNSSQPVMHIMWSGWCLTLCAMHRICKQKPPKLQKFLIVLTCTVETAFYNHPLVQQKTVLKGRWSGKRGSLWHAHAKSTLFFSSNLKGKAFSEQLQPTCSCIHWYLTFLLYKVYKKVVPSLHKPTTRYMFTLRWYAGTFTCKWLCSCKIWRSLVAFGR